MVQETCLQSAIRDQITIHCLEILVEIVLIQLVPQHDTIRIQIRETNQIPQEVSTILQPEIILQTMEVIIRVEDLQVEVTVVADLQAADLQVADDKNTIQLNPMHRLLNA
jgi:hypothetical protein